MIDTSVIFFAAIFLALLFIVSFSYSERGLYGECAADYDCMRGLSCSNGICKVSVGGECSSLAECGDDSTHCFRGICINTSPGKLDEKCPCDNGLACDPRSLTCKATTGCASDSDCVYGNVCITASGDGVCTSQSGVYGPCSSTSHCVEGLACKQFAFRHGNDYSDTVDYGVTMSYVPGTLTVDGDERAVPEGAIVNINPSNPSLNIILTDDGKLRVNGTMIRTNLKFVIPFGDDFIGVNTSGNIYTFDVTGMNKNISTTEIDVDPVDNMYRYNDIEHSIVHGQNITAIDTFSLTTNTVPMVPGQIIILDRNYHYLPKPVCA